MRHSEGSLYETAVNQLDIGRFCPAHSQLRPSASNQLVINAARGNDFARAIDSRLHFRNGGRN